jgi:hypothetical protein
MSGAPTTLIAAFVAVVVAVVAALMFVAVRTARV